MIFVLEGALINDISLVLYISLKFLGRGLTKFSFLIKKHMSKEKIINIIKIVLTRPSILCQISQKF